MKKVLKSFATAHEAVSWLSKNRLNGASIETTSTLKSFGYGRIPSGNYHVITLKSPSGAPSEDFFNPHDAATEGYERARESIDTSTEERPTLLRQMGPLTRTVEQVKGDASSAAYHDGDEYAEEAAEDSIDDLVSQTANRFGITHPEKIARLREILDEERFIKRKSIVTDIVDKVLKSMGY
jgi:hypothetical protein